MSSSMNYIESAVIRYQGQKELIVIKGWVASNDEIEVFLCAKKNSINKIDAKIDTSILRHT